jgi:hypothetical protein
MTEATKLHFLRQAPAFAISAAAFFVLWAIVTGVV